MAQPENDFDDIFNGINLYDDAGHSNPIYNDIQLSNSFLFSDVNQYQNLSPFPFDLDNLSDSQITTDGTIATEFVHLLPSDAQQDMIAIVDNEQLIENPGVTNDPIPQQAAGSENEIQYQMLPNIFANFINGTISVKQQPKANKRLRYSCDGARFLPDSRYHPMSINLPDLRSISLGPNQKLGIVMTLATTTNNPQVQTFVHANDIMYREKDAVKIGYGCVFVPLASQSGIENFEQKFKRLSIMYKKCDEYTFNLTAFDASTMFGPTEKYSSTNNKKAGNAAKAKDFKREYDLLSYKIVFHLALKENNVVYISNITCETDIVEETQISQKSGKRSASPSMDNVSEAEESDLDTQLSSPSKKFKSSPPPPLIGLPVTRVSNLNVETNMDHENDLA